MLTERWKNMGKHCEYTDRFIRLHISTLGASSQCFSRCDGRGELWRHFEEYYLLWQIVLSKQEEKRKVCETPRKLGGWGLELWAVDFGSQEKNRDEGRPRLGSAEKHLWSSNGSNSRTGETGWPFLRGGSYLKSPLLSVIVLSVASWHISLVFLVLIVFKIQNSETHIK